jgi:hypothetical protein
MGGSLLLRAGRDLVRRLDVSAGTTNDASSITGCRDSSDPAKRVIFRSFEKRVAEPRIKAAILYRFTALRTRPTLRD